MQSGKTRGRSATGVWAFRPGAAQLERHVMQGSHCGIAWNSLTWQLICGVDEDVQRSHVLSNGLQLGGWEETVMLAGG